MSPIRDSRKKNYAIQVCLYLHDVVGITGRRESAQFADEFRLEKQVYGIGSVRALAGACSRPRVCADSPRVLYIHVCTPVCGSAMIVIA